jgi:GPH family glycoside/pentoside/hexuronide:cation symporter
MVALYLLYFYTDVLGLSLSMAGLIFFLASIWDAVTDPVMAWIVERTRGRLGRYRPYLLFGAVPFAICMVALFYRPSLEGRSLFFWALALHLAFRTAYTCVYVPYTALITRLSTDADERATIAGVKNAFISLGSLTVSYVALPAVTWLGGADEAAGFLRFALVCAVLCVVALWVCFWLTAERQTADDQTPHPAHEPTVLQQLRLIGRNGPFLLIFAGVIAFTGCYTILNKSIIYVFKYDLGDRDAASWALSAMALAGVVSPLLWVRVTHWTSKRAVWIGGSLLASASLFAIYLTEARAVHQLVLLLFLAGCGIHAFLMTFFAMVADVVDYGEWLHGQRIEAPLFGLVSLANKTSLAVGTLGLTLMLEAIGFDANAKLPPQTVAGLRQIMTLVPPVGFLASALIIAFFPLTTERHRMILAELNVRRAATL